MNVNGSYFNGSFFIFFMNLGLFIFSRLSMYSTAIPY